MIPFVIGLVPNDVVGLYMQVVGGTYITVHSCQRTGPQPVAHSPLAVASNSHPKIRSFWSTLLSGADCTDIEDWWGIMI